MNAKAKRDSMRIFRIRFTDNIFRLSNTYSFSLGIYFNLQTQKRSRLSSNLHLTSIPSICIGSAVRSSLNSSAAETTSSTPSLPALTSPYSESLPITPISWAASFEKIHVWLGGKPNHIWRTKQGGRHGKQEGVTG
ncbi:hypothetical protein V8F33_007805 [Rhypophila sp. PSN 637]